MYSLPSLKNSKCHNQSWQNKAGVEWIKTLQLNAFYIKKIKIKNEKLKKSKLKSKNPEHSFKKNW